MSHVHVARVRTYPACRTCPAEKGSLAARQRRLPATADREETRGSSEEACDPGPETQTEVRGEKTKDVLKDTVTVLK